MAEERERTLKDAFERFDFDGSGSMDMEEILPLLDDLGLAKRLKTDRIEFCTKMFLHFDANQDGVLSFEEFKGFYNAAIDDAAGKAKAKPKVSKGRTFSSLDAETEGKRAKIAEERARKKAEESERIRRENAEMKARIASQNKGRDTKALDDEVMKMRRQKAAERAQKRRRRRSALRRRIAP